MNNDDKIFLNHIKDLADTAYNQNRYTFSNFLTVDEQAMIDTIRPEIKYIHSEFYGGYDDAERRVLRFGSEDMLGYIEEYPISVICIEPLMEKFSDELTHRDYLGSLMNLGINRNVLGDIVIKDKKAFVFCLNEISEYILSEITRIKHTSVKLSIVRLEDFSHIRQLEDMEILVSSPRIDSIAAAICKLSRSKVLTLFKEKKILVNNRVCENNSLMLKDNTVISIRGFGKYIYEGQGGTTRKDRVYLKMKKYV